MERAALSATIHRAQTSQAAARRLNGTLATARKALLADLRAALDRCVKQLEQCVGPPPVGPPPVGPPPAGPPSVGPPPVGPPPGLKRSLERSLEALKGREQRDGSSRRSRCLCLAIWHIGEGQPDEALRVLTKLQVSALPPHLYPAPLTLPNPPSALRVLTMVLYSRTTLQRRTRSRSWYAAARCYRWWREARERVRSQPERE